MIPWVADYGLLMYDSYISRDIEDKCFRYVTLNTWRCCIFVPP